MNRLQKISEDLGKNQQVFRYTTDKGCLTLEQRQFYEQNGYLVLRQFLKEKDIENWRKRFLEYCDESRQALNGMAIVKDISLVKKNKGQKLKGEENITKVQNFQDDQVLHSYCTNSDLIPYLKSFCGNNIKSVHTMFINKPPGMGVSSRHPFHQDLAYFPFGPTDQIVAAWASLEDASKQNGSLNIFPKSHKGKFYIHEYPDDGEVNKAYFGIVNHGQDIATKIDLEMKKGDIVLFHPLLIHGSGQNKTTGFRKSLCCHFASSECNYIPYEGKVQELVAKEVLGILAKKYPNRKIDYHQYWRQKAKLVNGQQFQDGI